MSHTQTGIPRLASRSTQKRDGDCVDLAPFETRARDNGARCFGRGQLAPQLPELYIRGARKTQADTLTAERRVAMFTPRFRGSFNVQCATVGRFVAGALILPAASEAQQVPTVKLQQLAVLDSELSNVHSARELHDGRLLVSDSRDQIVLLLSIGAPRQVVGRKGNGPGEYQIPTQLFAVGKDSTIVVDGGARRWLLLNGTRFVEPSEVLKKMGIAIGGELEGVDARANVLTVRGTDVLKKGEKFRYTGAPLASTAVAIIRIRPDGKSDTLARGKGGWVGKKQIRIKSSSGIEIIDYISPLPTYDQPVIFQDGQIAIARTSPYRVDWISSAGEMSIGRPVQEPAIPVTERMKKSIAGAHTRKGTKPSDFPMWPATLPPFLRQSVLAGADGRVYVKRTRIAKAIRN